MIWRENWLNFDLESFYVYWILWSDFFPIRTIKLFWYKSKKNITTNYIFAYLLYYTNQTTLKLRAF